MERFETQQHCLGCSSRGALSLPTSSVRRSHDLGRDGRGLAWAIGTDRWKGARAWRFSSTRSTSKSLESCRSRRESPMSTSRNRSGSHQRRVFDGSGHSNAPGVVRRYVALVDPAAVNLGVTVFVQITLDLQVEGRLEIFEHAILRRPEVLECYLMTGDADYLLRVVVPDVAGYERFLRDTLTRIESAAGIKSSFALETNQILDGAASRRDDRRRTSRGGPTEPAPGRPAVPSKGKAHRAGPALRAVANDVVRGERRRLFDVLRSTFYVHRSTFVVRRSLRSSFDQVASSSSLASNRSRSADRLAWPREAREGRRSA